MCVLNLSKWFCLFFEGTYPGCRSLAWDPGPLYLSQALSIKYFSLPFLAGTLYFLLDLLPQHKVYPSPTSRSPFQILPMGCCLTWMCRRSRGSPRHPASSSHPLSSRSCLHWTIWKIPHNPSRINLCTGYHSVSQLPPWRCGSCFSLKEKKKIISVHEKMHKCSFLFLRDSSLTDK